MNSLVSVVLLLIFQSTPSVGRATIAGTKALTEFIFQSTPSMGRATAQNRIAERLKQFQSTPSVGRATTNGRSADDERFISIHALRGEGDPHTPPLGEPSLLFQSTPSVGRATRTRSRSRNNRRFQSTPSVGRATTTSKYLTATQLISIHALRGEGDENVRTYALIQ